MATWNKNPRRHQLPPRSAEPYEVVDTLFKGAFKGKHSPIVERNCSSDEGNKSEDSWWPPEEKKEAATETPSVVPELENTCQESEVTLSKPVSTPSVPISTPGKTPRLQIIVGRPLTQIISREACQAFMQEMEEKRQLLK